MITPCETLPPVPQWWWDGGLQSALKTKPREVELLERQISRWPKAFADDETYRGKIDVVDGVGGAEFKDAFEMEMTFPSRVWGVPREGTMFEFFNTIRSRAESFVLGAMKDKRATTVIGTPEDIYGKWSLVEWSGPIDCVRVKLRCDIIIKLA